MKKLYVTLLILVLCGCSLPHELSTWNEAASPGEEDTPVVVAAEEPFDCDISSLQTAAESLSLFSSDAYGFDDAGTLVADPEEALNDLETLADNLLLSGLEQTPPVDEGVTVPSDGRLFDFPVVENDKVRYFINYYTGHGRGVFARWLQRSGRYLPMMRRVFAEHDLPQDLAYLAMVESGFNERAYSWAHAVGPWQFIESTAKGYGLKSDWWLDERRDFEKSTHAAARFLGDLYTRFDGNWYLAVASYNAGGGKINRAVQMYQSTDFWTLTRGSYLQEETKNYLPKLLAVLLISRNPQAYGFDDLEYHEPFNYDEVALPSATDLEVVARLCAVDYETIKELNPELKRWCTPPGVKGYVIRVPAGTRQQFVEGYAALPVAERANYLRHRIAPGDTLLNLAKKHKIRVDDIITLNNISNPRALKLGTDLILPLKKGYTTLPLQELEDDYVRTRRATYTVRSGDSLWKISQKFDVSEKELRVWNRLGWSNLLRPGQKLIVSKKGRGTEKVSRNTGPLKKIVYQVRSGDTLWGIGRRYETTTEKILAWNNLPADHILRPGDRLTLMVPDSHRG